ncbi:MAG: hypothetical protein SV760_05715, partial [Halobacteria archaeon]|nr:hypothetical protein [Halobacteria archaeon]
MSEDEAEVKVELEEVDEGETEEVVEAGELLTELRNVFGGLVLTTDVDESRGEVSVNGENWKVEANVDGEMLFKPGGRHSASCAAPRTS